MPAKITQRLVLASAALLACTVGCRSPAPPAGVAHRSSWRDMFRRDPRDVAAQRAREAEEADAPKDIGDPTELSLMYARWREDVKDLPEARKHYSKVAEQNPKNLEAVLGLARIDLASGMTYEAEQGFLKA